MEGLRDIPEPMGRSPDKTIIIFFFSLISIFWTQYVL